MVLQVDSLYTIVQWIKRYTIHDSSSKEGNNIQIISREECIYNHTIQINQHKGTTQKELIWCDQNHK